MSKLSKIGNRISRSNLDDKIADRVDREAERERLDKAEEAYEEIPKFKKRVKIFENNLQGYFSFIGAVQVFLNRSNEGRKFKSWLYNNSKATRNEIVNYILETYDIYAEDMTHQERLIWSPSQIKIWDK